MAAVNKMTVAERLRLPVKQYRAYMDKAVQKGVEKMKPISSLSKPVEKPRPERRVKHTETFIRLGMTREEYREKVYKNKNSPQYIASPRKSRNAKPYNKKAASGFTRLAMGPKEYREAVKNRAATAKSLLPVKRSHSQVNIPGRQPMSVNDRKNFDRLAMTKEERKAAKQKGFEQTVCKVGGYEAEFKPNKAQLLRDIRAHTLVRKTSNKTAKRASLKNQYKHNSKETVPNFDRLSMTRDEYREWQKAGNKIDRKPSSGKPSKAKSYMQRKTRESSS